MSHSGYGLRSKRNFRYQKEDSTIVFQGFLHGFEVYLRLTGTSDAKQKSYPEILGPKVGCHFASGLFLFFCKGDFRANLAVEVIQFIIVGSPLDDHLPYFGKAFLD